MKRYTWVFLFLFVAFWVHADTWTVGSSVELESQSPLGVPLHNEPGNRAVSGRLPDGAVVKIEEVDPQTGWLRISHPEGSGWIITKYVADEVGEDGDGGAPTVVIGAWNLEYFNGSKTRGFPENTKGGRTYPPRTASDIQLLASTIRNLSARILVLCEIGAGAAALGEEPTVQSEELAHLADALGEGYDYVIGASGGEQHLAILYDTQYVRLNADHECSFPEETEDGKNVFDRQPLFAHFTLLSGGTPMNDLLVVGVHLASGQHHTKNHDMAMDRLVEEIAAARQEESCVPADEYDVVIMGDFNANRFDSKKEKFWDDMEQEGWDVLADDDATYPATRLSGNPLTLGNSKIDYIIVSSGNGGLQGEEITTSQATVHTELLEDDPETFRAYASDHLPVTAALRVTTDNDYEH